MRVMDPFSGFTSSPDTPEPTNQDDAFLRAFVTYLQGAGAAMRKFQEATVEQEQAFRDSVESGADYDAALAEYDGDPVVVAALAELDATITELRSAFDSAADDFDPEAEEEEDAYYEGD